MSRKEKIDHILTYYWLPVFGVIFGIAFAIYLFSHILFGIRENWIYITLVNVPVSDEGVSTLKDAFTEYAGYDPRQKNVVFNANSYFDAATLQGTNNSYFQVFVAMVESGDLDAVIAGRENLAAVGAGGRLKDLSSDEVSSFFDKYRDRFIYCTPNDEEYSTGEVPVGIDISDSRVVTEYGIYTGDCALGMGAYSDNIDEVLRFLKFVLPETEG